VNNRSFTLVFDEKGHASFYDEQGASVQIPEASRIFCQLQGQFDYVYLYIISKDKLHKIGVTKNIKRRRKEIGGWIYHHIFCHPRRVYQLEDTLHMRLASFRVKDEWFDFNSEQGTLALAQLSQLHNDEDLIKFLKLGWSLPFNRTEGKDE
jgi:hypothetical protein